MATQQAVLQTAGRNLSVEQEFVDNYIARPDMVERPEKFVGPE
jgi:hypothetical protein